MSRKVQDWLLAILTVVLVGILLFPYLFAFPPTNPASEQSDIAQGSMTPCSVVFMSCGQADSTLLYTDRYTMLIDCGLNDSYGRIRNQLEAMGVDHLDAVVLTHPHLDHGGGMAQVLRHFPTAQVYFADIPESLTSTAKWFTRILDAIEETGSALTILKEGDTIEMGTTGGKLEVLHSGNGSDLNNCSLVLRMTYGATKVLLTADIEREAEARLVASGKTIQADILKVPHHGSRSSSTRDFLQQVQPKVAVISCGEDNEYGYPKPDVLQRLEEVGAAIYRTDTQGHVTVLLNGDTYEIKTEVQDAA